MSRLYFKAGDRIADVTYGRGYFWRKTDMSHFTFLPSDILTGTDFRDLPYENGSIDVVSFDPPYVKTEGRHYVLLNSYNTGTPLHSYKDVLQLFSEGMTEAKRVLKNGGLMLVKCMDQVEAGRQHIAHLDIIDIGKEMGLVVKDLFVLLRGRDRTRSIPMTGRTQIHSRKNHSFLIVFKNRRSP